MYYDLDGTLKWILTNFMIWYDFVQWISRIHMMFCDLDGNLMHLMVYSVNYIWLKIEFTKFSAWLWFQFYLYHDL
jgi:hypothetical protein